MASDFKFQSIAELRLIFESDYLTLKKELFLSKLGTHITKFLKNNFNSKDNKLIQSELAEVVDAIPSNISFILIENLSNTLQYEVVNKYLNNEVKQEHWGCYESFGITKG